jgi:hypothetical protein
MVNGASMKRVSIILLSILSVALVSCAGQTTSSQSVVTAGPYPTPPTANTPSIYPAPVVATPYPAPPNYPPPITSSTPAMAVTPIPSSNYEPQAGDNQLKRDVIYLDLAASQLIVTGDETVKVIAMLTGNLPDPRHILRMVVEPPNAQDIINIEAYSLVEPGMTTTQALTPFRAEIPVGTYSSGEYTVMVNGEELGVFATDYAPRTGDVKLARGEASVDFAASELVTTGNQPKKAAIILSGTLPDPCHQLRVAVSPANAQQEINLEVYSVFDPTMMCIMVIKPFEVSISLGSFSGGHFSVFVNGQLIGSFDG